MILPFLIMTTISLMTRLIPFLFAKRLLHSPLLQKINLLFPSCICILLVAHCLKSSHGGSEQILALGCVLFLQIFFRNILLSMGSGIVIHQILLHFLL